MQQLIILARIFQFKPEKLKFVFNLHIAEIRASDVWGPSGFSFSRLTSGPLKFLKLLG